MSRFDIERPTDVIDLGRGHPAPELLPLALLRQAALTRLSEPHTDFLEYGSGQGDERFRSALARFLGTYYGAPVGPETLLVTGGASSALHTVCALFSQPGDTVLVEEPSYFLALRIFADRGLKVVGVPIDDEGLIVEALEETLKTCRPAFLYTIPTFQNPTGITLSAARREQLLTLCVSRDLLLIADEVYQLLSYGATPPPPFAIRPGGARLISLGSFSKILAPGLRLGWLQSTPEIIGRVVESGLVQSGGGFNPFTSALITGALESGALEAHLTRLRCSYGARAAALSRALVPLAGQVSYGEPEGGYFLWLELTQVRDAAALLDVSGSGVTFQPGRRFSSSGRFSNFLRLSFSYYGAAALSLGVERLGRLLGREASG